MTRRLWAAACLTILSLPVGHQVLAAPFHYFGVGTNSCGWWTEVRRHQGTATWAEQWALGFLAGASDFGPSGLDPLGDTDAEGAWAWVDRYCSSHPTDRVIKALEELTKARSGAL